MTGPTEDQGQRPMAEARGWLAGLGLPDRDLGELPTSARRFPDGAQYRVEIPSVEGAEPFRAVANGVPITVNVKCAGGTHASATVTLTKTGSVSVGQTTFEPGWPAGTDCVVSHELVTGIEAVEGIITWVDSNDVQATFTDV